MDYATLKARHRRERERWPEGPLTLRVHRALSWLNRAEQCDDPDGRFVFLWIAFALGCEFLWLALPVPGPYSAA
jgi:hypothetical protein